MRAYALNSVQGVVQQDHGLPSLPCDLTSLGEEGHKMGHSRHSYPRPGGTVTRPTVAQERYPLRHIAIIDLGPAAIDRSQRTPVGEALFGRHRNQLAGLLSQGCALSIERMQPGADLQALSERRLMSQSPRLSDCRA